MRLKRICGVVEKLRVAVEIQGISLRGRCIFHLMNSYRVFFFKRLCSAGIVGEFLHNNLAVVIVLAAHIFGDTRAREQQPQNGAHKRQQQNEKHPWRANCRSALGVENVEGKQNRGDAHHRLDDGHILSYKQKQPHKPYNLNYKSKNRPHYAIHAVVSFSRNSHVFTVGFFLDCSALWCLVTKMLGFSLSQGSGMRWPLFLLTSTALEVALFELPSLLTPTNLVSAPAANGMPR